jgi:pyruvate/2-oxoglutarate dehydrogenase complex dihydrolipoamide acyltransferase (E2) component
MRNESHERVGRYEVRAFPLSRIPIIDTATVGKAKHHIPVLVEVDVTRAREELKTRKDASGGAVSFTGWMIKCLAQAASEHKRSHAMRLGRRKLVLFDDVDVGVVIQREMTGAGGEAMPLPYLIRKANEKSLDEIHAEIRGAQAAGLKPGEQVLGEKNAQRRGPRPSRLFFGLPFFLRKHFIWNRLSKNPFFAKKTMGTVAVSSISGFTRVGTGAGFGIATSIAPLALFIGQIARKPGIVEDTFAVREFVSLTILFDHDVIDGAPIALFLGRLRELMESAAFLG